MKKRLAAFLLLLLLLTISLAGLGTAAAAPGQEAGKASNKVIVVLANRISFGDLKEKNLPNIKKLSSMGGLGLMTVNTAGNITDASACYTLGASRRATATEYAGAFFNAREQAFGAFADALYFRNTGITIPPGELVNPYIPSLGWNAQKASTDNSVTLGDILHKNGFKTAVIGCSDGYAPHGPEDMSRFAPLILADAEGRIDVGDMSSSFLRFDPMSPFSHRTNYDYLYEKLRHYLPSVDVMAIETGDSYRTELESPFMSAARLAEQKDKDLVELDRFVGRLLPLVNRETLVMLVAPLPPKMSLDKGCYMAPVMVAGGTMARDTVLSSTTTRWEGLVSSHDFAPTVLTFLGLEKPLFMAGLPLKGVSPGHTWDKLTVKYEELSASYENRQPLLHAYLKFAAFVMAVMAVIIAFRWPWGYKPCRAMALAALAGPTVLLILPLLGRYPLYIEGLLAVGLTALAVALLWPVRKPELLWITGSLMFLVPAVVDIFGGGYLAGYSPMGYDALVAGRFYGIGNESMGIVISAAIIVTGATLNLFPAHRRKLLVLAAVFFAFLIFFIASPVLGTNAGGTLAAVCGFSVALYFLFGFKMNRRALLVLVLAFLGGLAALMAINFFFGNQSHIGRFVGALAEGRFGYIGEAMVRKLVSNWQLVSTLWMQVLAVGVFSVVLVLIFRYREISATSGGNRDTRAATAGVLAGMAAAILFNDTGITSAALMFSWAVPPVFLFIYENVLASTREEISWARRTVLRDYNG